jgi:hypothetical protein
MLSKTEQVPGIGTHRFKEAIAKEKPPVEHGDDRLLLRHKPAIEINPHKERLSPFLRTERRE